jgi:hypothetical protein
MQFQHLLTDSPAKYAAVFLSISQAPRLKQNGISRLFGGYFSQKSSKK